MDNPWYFTTYGFYPQTENLCVMMRENLNAQSSDYIVIYQDEL